MHELSEIFRPSWGTERWISAAWCQLVLEEKTQIQTRVDAVFKNGLPFELKKDKVYYIHIFALLAQLEVFAIQLPLQCQNQLAKPEHESMIRNQLLDDIFHCIVFTKIVYMLSEPYAVPCAYDNRIDDILTAICNDESPQMAFLILNAMSESWVKEIVHSLERAGVASDLFSVIIENKSRRVSGSKLHRKNVEALDSGEVLARVAFYEEKVLSAVFMHYQYMFSLVVLMGVNEYERFIGTFIRGNYDKFVQYNLKSAKHWLSFSKMVGTFIPQIKRYSQSYDAVELSPLRQMFMASWDDPSDPTMVADFNLDVSCVEFFNKKFPSETITILMMQAISLGLSETESFRYYLNNKKMYQTREAYLGLVVKLPGCGDHLGNIVFENCHLMSAQELSIRIQHTVKMMAYCYQQRKQLELAYPELKLNMQNTFAELANSLYDFPVLGTDGVVTLSNVGSYGYSSAKSPLFSNESAKFTLSQIDRKPVWDHHKQMFEPKDILPVTVSADHRVFDGNNPLPKLTADCFKRMFDKMVIELSKSVRVSPVIDESELLKFFEGMLEVNVELVYKLLYLRQTFLMDFLSIEPALSKSIDKALAN